MKWKIMALFMVIIAITTGCSQTTSAPNAVAKEQSEPSAKTSDSVNTSREIFAMDTYMTVTAYGNTADLAEAAVDSAQKEIERLDALLSTGSDTSEVTVLNNNHGGALSADTNELIAESIKLYQETDGAFDITIYPVMEAWGFTTQDYRVPDQSTLNQLLPTVSASLLSYDKTKQSVAFESDQVKIDLGGIAKGYTSSRVIDLMREQGVESAMINLGGNVQVLGTKTDGSNWRVAIQNPENDSDYLGILEVADKAVITSGGYERYFEQDGKTYHHIIDPKTGYPVENGMKSVTIVSEDGMLADALSTSLFVMGREKAVEFWKSGSEDFDFIFETEDGTLYVSEGIANDFSSEQTIEIIKK